MQAKMRGLMVAMGLGAALLAAGEAKKKGESEGAAQPFTEIAPRYREKIAAQEKAVEQAKDDKSRRAAVDVLGWTIADYLHNALDAEYARWQQANQANKGKAAADAESSPQKECDDLCSRLESLYSPETTFFHVPHPFYIGPALTKDEIRTAQYVTTNKTIKYRDLLKRACTRRSWGGLGYGEPRRMKRKGKGGFELFFETNQSVVTTFYLQSPSEQRATLTISLADKADIVELAAVNNQVAIGAADEGGEPKAAKIGKSGNEILASANIALRKGLNMFVVITRNVGSQRHDLGFKVDGRDLHIVSQYADAE